MPITRSPPGATVKGPLETVSEQSTQGVIASALSTLPLDAGTVISPTLVRQTRGNPGSRATCNGGPGNVTCGMEVRDGQQGVECDICGNWSHAVCQKVSKAAYNALSKHIRILAFICDACRQRPSFLDMQAKPSTRDASVQPSDSCGQPGIQSRDTDVLSCLKEKVQLLESSIQELTKMIADSKQTMNTMVETQQQSLHSSQQRTYAESLKSPPGVHSEADCAPPPTRLFKPVLILGPEGVVTTLPLTTSIGMS